MFGDHKPRQKGLEKTLNFQVKMHTFHVNRAKKKYHIDTWNIAQMSSFTAQKF